MLVVMAIIGLIAAISGPSVAAGIDSVRMASATSSVSTFLNSAVTRAERRQQPVELVISPKQRRLSLYSNEPGFERQLDLPDGIDLEAVLPPTNDDPEAARSVIVIPGDPAPAIGVQLANGHGTRRIVRLDPMTGFPRVESVDNQ